MSLESCFWGDRFFRIFDKIKKLKDLFILNYVFICVYLILGQRLAVKLMGLGLTNRIDDDSDFKLVDFDRRLQSDSKSNDKSHHWRLGFQAGRFRSSITVRFRIQQRIQIDDGYFDLNSISFDLFSIKIDHFWSIFHQKIEKDSPNVDSLIENNDYIIKNDELYQKRQIISKTTNKTTKIRLFLTIFDLIRPVFDMNRTICDVNCPDSNQIVATGKSGC